MKPNPLSEVDLDEIEAEAKTAAETYRVALLPLVGAVGRLRGIALGAPRRVNRAENRGGEADAG